MRHGKRYASMFLFIITIFLIGSCIEKKSDPLTPEERSWLEKHDGEIRLAAEPEYPPVSFFDDKGKLSGIDADLIKLIENRLDFKFKIVRLGSWREIIDNAKKRKIDVVALIMKNEERSAYMNFTEPHIHMKNLIFVKNDIKGTIRLDDMNTLKTGVTSGYAVEKFLLENYPDLSLIPVKNDPIGLGMLSAGDIDAFIATAAIASYWMEKRGIENLRVAGDTGFDYKLGMATRNDWPVLNSILDKGISLISKDAKQKIQKKWINLQNEEMVIDDNFKLILVAFLSVVTLFILILFFLKKSTAGLSIKSFSVITGELRYIVTASLLIAIVLIIFFGLKQLSKDPLTPEERAWLNEHDGKIIISNEAGWPPIIDTDKDGDPVGIAADYYRHIEKKLDFKFKLDRLDTWENVVNKLRTRKIDVICEMQKNAERSEYGLFTKPYIEIPNAIVVRKEIKGSLTLEKMSGMKIAVSEGYAIHDYINSNYGYLQLVPYEEDINCLLETSTRNVDAAVVNLAVASFLIEKEGIANLRIAGYAGFTNALSLAVRKDWPVLNRILDKGLDLITKSERDAIYRKWIFLGYMPFYKNRNFWIVACGVTAVIISIFVMILLWNLSLKKLVVQRTEILEKRTDALKKEIAERRQAEEELRHLRNYLSNIIDSMPSILVGVDTHGKVTQWNNTAEQTTGIAADAAQGKTLSDLFPQMVSQMEKITESIRTREVRQELKRPRLSENGICYEDVTIYPLVANGVEGAVIRIDDVTDKVRMEEMMIQSEKMLSVGGLAAGMAHEINNPIAGMIQTASVMANRLGENINIPANQKAAEAAGTSMEAIEKFMEARGIPRMITAINESGRRVAAIVENMLSFARKSDAQVYSHLLSELLDKILELAATDYDLKKNYDFRRIEIRKEYEDKVPLVSCEGAKIQQVLLNILRNGAQAMQEAGVPNPKFIFRTRFERERKMVCMEIEDNGPGMDEATRKRVFEPFFTTKPVGMGTGLGLSVSYFIITENHGGELAVESRPGSGAKFIIRLPLEGGKA